MGLVDDVLSEDFARLQAQTLGFEIDSESDLSASEQLDAYMESQVTEFNDQFQDDDSADGTSDDQDVLKWYNDHFSESELDDDGDEQTDRDPFDTDVELDPADAAQPQTVFKTLFHRVARALHPDKETDPEQREYKQSLMAQLLEARRQRDLMQVFELYQEYVDNTATFDMQELAELEKVLCQYIELESERQFEITTKTDLHDIAYTQFYSDDPDEVEKAIAEKIQDVKNRQIEIESFSETVTSLKKLGPYLEDRFERLRENQ